MDRHGFWIGSGLNLASLANPLCPTRSGQPIATTPRTPHHMHKQNSNYLFTIPLLLSMAALVACTELGSSSEGTPTTFGRSGGPDAPVVEFASKASCGPGSNPETGIQGRVSREDRDSGRSQAAPFDCNMRLVGQFQGEGTTWVNRSYKSCAYMATALGILPRQRPGVQVVDVSNPSKPNFVQNLATPAFLTSTWESLSVDEGRGLLAGVSVGPLVSALFFDIYDISEDCTRPKLLNGLAGPGGLGVTLPANAIGHEGEFSPDGKTYWSSGLRPGSLTAIDVANPSLPRPIYFAVATPSNHGFEFNPDGTRMYLTTLSPAGVAVLDTSSIQNRSAVMSTPILGQVNWDDGDLSQHTIYVTYDGKPFLLAVDEGGNGAARFIDLQDETAPKVISKLKLEIHSPANADLVALDTQDEGIFGYEAHYCEFDRRVNPTALACGYFQSGIRVFDVRNPFEVKEIAYFNPPGQAAKRQALLGSEHANGFSVLLAGSAPQPPAMKVDWCSSPPRFVGNQIWVACQDNGFMVLELTNGVYPLR